ncbi:MAG: carboxypeptidase regulatory-like domain-containing protein [Xanthomonadales bacterium PRO7]|nr:carboxypeptidase regulatory-like domain-containing protein [Xanthomonadales bacterium PRO7]
MRRLLFWLLVPLVLVVVIYSGELPELVMTYSPKTGRVVDATTGKGIPGVTVTALGWFWQGGLFTTSSGCTFASFGLTDANGYYRTPSGWRRVNPGAPWFHPGNSWTINAVKPGYTLVDKSNFKAGSGEGAVVTSKWKIFSVGVSDIVMRAVDLPLKERVEDYAYGMAGDNCASTDPSLYHELRNEVFSDLKARVCALPADTPLDEKTVWGLEGFSSYLTPDSRSVERFKQRLIKLDPAYSQTLNPSHPPHDYRAGDLCSVMTEMGNDK